MSVSIDPDSKTARATRKLRESSNSVVLTIPPQILQQAGVECGDEVDLVTELGSGEIAIQSETADEDSQD
jgi:antitoxin component of MazEF toxin-antitoxin module